MEMEKKFSQFLLDFWHGKNQKRFKTELNYFFPKFHDNGVLENVSIWDTISYC